MNPLTDDQPANTSSAGAQVSTGVPLSLSAEDRIISGLASGIGARLGIEAVYLRAAFVSLGLIWGLGVVLYVAGLAAAAGQERRTMTSEPASPSQRRGLLMIGLGTTLFLRAVGFWPGDIVVWPLTAVAFGAAFLVDQRDLDSRQAIQSFLDPSDRTTRSRTFIGVGLTLFGLVMLGSAAVPTVGSTMLAVLVTGVGSVLLFGPWMWRLIGALTDERASRIRSEERAEMAAHLHDSVLQTLALIQRSDDPRRMVTLARAQERALRRWLYERGPDSADDRISDALSVSAARVEEDFDVTVEVINVGDAVLSDMTKAQVAAAGEAMINAAKHAKADRISVYCEVTAENVDIFVTDQGIGFDPDAIDPERRGLCDSIVARMHRHGGEARVTSSPGEGTEIHLKMPRREL